MTVKIQKCNCENHFQDDRYGEKMRVMNLTKKGNDSKKVYRCTVCGKES